MKKGLAGYLSVAVVFLYAYAIPLNFLVFREGVGGVLMLLVLVPFFFVGQIGKFFSRTLSKDEQLLGVLVASVCVSISLQQLFFSDYLDFEGRSVRVNLLTLMAVNALWLMAGLAFSSVDLKRSDGFSAALLVGVLAIVLPNLNDALLIPYVELVEVGVEGANHLMIGEMLLFICFFAYSVADVYLRPVAIAAAALLLFSAGGRSSLYFGVGALLLVEFFLSGGRGRTSVLLVLVLVGALFFFSGLDLSDSLVQRMFFSEGVGVDASYTERDEFLRVGLQLLPQQILFGDPFLLARTNGVVGSYIHNGLSMWQFFGLVPFMLLVVVVSRLGIKVLSFAKVSRSPFVVFGLLCYVYAATGLLFSKSIGFPILWFAVGFWSSRALPFGRK